MSIYLGAWWWTKTLSDMKWPCPDWFHVPYQSERYNIYDVWSNTIWSYWNGANFSKYLKLPMAWRRLGNRPDLNYNVGSLGRYWSSLWYTNNYTMAYLLSFESSSISASSLDSCNTWYSVRAIKDSPVAPTSSWTTLYNDWYRAIYHNADLWLISITSYWTTYTIMDKNLWATTVYNYWDSITEANWGYYFQRWNNHWFPWPWWATPSPTSWTSVDASWYWPWNYYDSSTWITWGWMTAPGNFNLWWWQTRWTYTEPLTWIGDVYVWSTKVKWVYVWATKIYP